MRLGWWRAAATLTSSTVLLVGAMRWLLTWSPPPATVGLEPGLDSVVVTLSVVRGAALVLGGYLLAVTTLALAVRLLRMPGAVVGLVDRLAPSAVRHLVRTVAGVAMTTVVTASPALATTTVPAPAPAVVTVGAAEQRRDLPTDEPVLMHRLPDVDLAPPPGPTTAPLEAPPPSGTATRVVAPGDHFWSIAEQHLAAVRGRPVTDAEIDPFWRAVLAANRDLTSDPDLLVPGQIVRLPATP